MEMWTERTFDNVALEYLTYIKWKWSCSVVSDSLWPHGLSLSGFSVCGIFQARVLEWVAVSFSRRSSQRRDQTRVFRIAGRRFTIWATREAQNVPYSSGLRYTSFIYLKSKLYQWSAWVLCNADWFKQLLENHWRRSYYWQNLYGASNKSI